MNRLSGKAKQEAQKWMGEAAKAAVGSLCLRAFCGCVIVHSGKIVGMGYNAPPRDDLSLRRCHRKSEVPRDFKTDQTCCMHAEQRAILDALRNAPKQLAGSTLYFTRVNEDGEVLFSGRPYCTVCSKLALDVGIERFVLWHEDGIVSYDTPEYNELSFAYKP